jgi:hypothetical protein
MDKGLIVTPDMAKSGGICPVCKKFFKPNGVGGSGHILTPIIDNLPSSSILRYGCNYHDWWYHLADNWGTRAQADYLMLKYNALYIDQKLSGVAKVYAKACNWRNYLAVRIFGKKFWDKEDCRKV